MFKHDSNKKTILSGFIAVFLFLGFSNAFAAENEYPPINPGDVIQSGSELSYPPFSVVDEQGNAGGFSVELLRAALKAEGLNVNFKIGEWSEVKNDLEVGNIRVLPLVGRTPEREAIFDFTVPYFSIRGAIYVRSGYDRINTFEDIKGKELIELEGDNAIEFIQRNNLTDKIFTTTTFDEAFEQLSSGKHDAIIVSTLVGDGVLDRLNIGNVVKLNIPIEGFTQSFCFAVRENDKELLEKLNEGLSIVIANGTYNTLKDKWFPPAETTYTTKEIIRYGFVALAVICIIFFSFFLITLKTQVKTKTKSLEEEIEKGKKLQKDLVITSGEVEIKNKEIELKNKELEETLTDFYTMRMGMQKDMDLGKVDEENKKIKSRLDKLKKK